jgi:aryl-alcohol dehydrogenase (NADP+)
VRRQRGNPWPRAQGIRQAAEGDDRDQGARGDGPDGSLRRLGTDYVDLYQIHRFDPLTPMEETLEALNDVVRAGKALYIGASSMYG